MTRWVPVFGALPVNITETVNGAFAEMEPSMLAASEEARRDDVVVFFSCGVAVFRPGPQVVLQLEAIAADPPRQYRALGHTPSGARWFLFCRGPVGGLALYGFLSKGGIA